MQQEARGSFPYSLYGGAGAPGGMNIYTNIYIHACMYTYIYIYIYIHTYIYK
jgi:hypothetical protein